MAAGHRDHGAVRRAGRNCGSQLRRRGAASKYRAGDPWTVRARERQLRARRSRRADAAAMLRHHAEPRRDAGRDRRGYEPGPVDPVAGRDHAHGDTRRRWSRRPVRPDCHSRTRIFAGDAGAGAAYVRHRCRSGRTRRSSHQDWMGCASTRDDSSDQAVGHRGQPLPVDHRRAHRCQRASGQRHVRNGSGRLHPALVLLRRRLRPLESVAMSDGATETVALTRRFGSFVAVDGVTLRIPKGELYGFLGLNGAGKTTTIRMLTTLLPPTEGWARLWGHDAQREPLAVRRLIGLVSDETSESQSTWTAREYLAYFARIRGLAHPV